MRLGADMVRDEADDALAIGEGEALPGIREAFRETVDPQPAIGIQHHLDDGGILEPRRDARPERRAQHPCATRGRLGLERMQRHAVPVVVPRQRCRSGRGQLQSGRSAQDQQAGRRSRVVACKGRPTRSSILNPSQYGATKRRGDICIPHESPSVRMVASKIWAGPILARCLCTGIDGHATVER